MAEAFLSMIQPAPGPVAAVTFPQNPTSLDGLKSVSTYTGSLTTFQTPIIGGINDYQGGSSVPGSAAGMGFGYFSSFPTNNGNVALTNNYATYQYSPSNFVGPYLGCTYTVSTPPTFASGLISSNGFSRCGLFLPNAAASANTAGAVQALSADNNNQYFSAPNPIAGFTGDQFPLVEGPGSTNKTSGNFSAIDNVYSSGVLQYQALEVGASGGSGAVRSLGALPSGYGFALNGFYFDYAVANGPSLTAVTSGNIPNSCSNGSIVTLNNNTIVGNASMALCVNGVFQVVGDWNSANTWTGANTFPTPATGNNSTLVATTAWVDTALAAQVVKVRAGTVTISASTTAAVTFATAMSVAPTSCALNPSASSATTGQPFATAFTTTGFTANVPTSGTLAMTYQCVVNNAN
jgi:hypothetical protein